MKHILLSLLLAAHSWGAITFFGSASQPADNSFQAGPTSAAITPPRSMVAGDLVFIAVGPAGSLATGVRKALLLEFVRLYIGDQS